MSEYPVVGERSKSASWSANELDLPGYTACRAHEDDAVEAVRISIELWTEEAIVQGLLIPPPFSTYRAIWT